MEQMTAALLTKSALLTSATLLIGAHHGFSQKIDGLAQKIDRQAVVRRHNVILTSVDTLASLTVGNGAFAFTVDATGLQSFPEYYAAAFRWAPNPIGAGMNFPTRQATNTARP